MYSQLDHISPNSVMQHICVQDDDIDEGDYSKVIQEVWIHDRSDTVDEVSSSFLDTGCGKYDDKE